MVVECVDAQMRLPAWANMSVDAGDCKCRAGYFATDNGTKCTLCPADSYCLGDTHIQACTEHAFAVQGSNHTDACICHSGYYMDGVGQCVPCPADSWCAGSVLNACPPNANSTAMASSLSQCSCLDGYGNPAASSTLCEPCPSGSIHTQWSESNACEACGPNMETDAVQTLCSCLTGYNQSSSQLGYEDGCDVCAFNYFGSTAPSGNKLRGFDGGGVQAVIDGKLWLWGYARAGGWWNWAGLWTHAFTLPDYPFVDNTRTTRWDNSDWPDGVVLEPPAIGEPSAVKDVQTKQANTHCILYENGRVRCWGLDAWMTRLEAKNTFPGGTHLHFGEYKDWQLNQDDTFLVSEILVNAIALCGLSMERDVLRCFGQWNHLNWDTATSTCTQTTSTYVGDNPADLACMPNTFFGNVNPGDTAIVLRSNNYLWHSCAVIAQAAGGNNRLFCWGFSQYEFHELTNPSYYRGVAKGRFIDDHLPADFNVADIEIGEMSACIISTDGRVKCVGKRWTESGGIVTGRGWASTGARTQQIRTSSNRILDQLRKGLPCISSQTSPTSTSQKV